MGTLGQEIKNATQKRQRLWQELYRYRAENNKLARRLDIAKRANGVLAQVVKLVLAGQDSADVVKELAQLYAKQHELINKQAQQRKTCEALINQINELQTQCDDLDDLNSLIGEWASGKFDPVKVSKLSRQLASVKATQASYASYQGREETISAEMAKYQSKTKDLVNKINRECENCRVLEGLNQMLAEWNKGVFNPAQVCDFDKELRNSKQEQEEYFEAKRAHEELQAELKELQEQVGTAANAVERLERYPREMAVKQEKVSHILRLENYPKELANYDWQMERYIKYLVKYKSLVYLLVGKDKHSDDYLLKIGSAKSWLKDRTVYTCASHQPDNHFEIGSEILIADAFITPANQQLTWELALRQCIQQDLAIKPVYGNEWFGVTDTKVIDGIKRWFNYFANHMHAEGDLAKQIAKAD